ncbi:unnamed protein product [Lupinus luteus]|uniref:Uncharacterized protein n=1 Tax=Lupinus luteus TaxID=3873 RepID=A0AAV1WM34_LUPLU
MMAHPTSNAWQTLGHQCLRIDQTGASHQNHWRRGVSWKGQSAPPINYFPHPASYAR